MWHEKTKQLVAEGKLTILGVVQEQHAERARLYRQWKQFDFPIAQDAITSLGLAVVPVPVLLDERGVVLAHRPSFDEVCKLVETPEPSIANQAEVFDARLLDVEWLQSRAADDPSVTNACALGDAVLWSSNRTAELMGTAIRAYHDALENADGPSRVTRGELEFRLGVAYRMRFDLTQANSKRPTDFAKASLHWSNALAQDPNQYIWRRRIQQYGPRQDKPYPFYDWVEKATNEIESRGETPVALSVPLSGAEVASPGKFEVRQATRTQTDLTVIELDKGELVEASATVVPQVVAAGDAVRVHLRFQVNQGKWNNESDPLTVWLESDEKLSTSGNSFVAANSKSATSGEDRTIEFEVLTSADAEGEQILRANALYHVCQPKTGICLLRRQVVTFNVSVTKSR